MQISLYRLRRPLVAGFALLAATFSVIAPGKAPQVIVSAVRFEQPIVVAPPVPTPVPAFVPTAIELPSLGVSAPIVPVGMESDGAMGTPGNARDVAWWDGVRVGEANALLAGHKDYKRSRGSFYRLGELKAGDPVIVSSPEGTLTFYIEWVQQLGKDIDATQILGDQGKPVLTLITCGGAFNSRTRHYQERVVARAVLA